MKFLYQSFVGTPSATILVQGRHRPPVSAEGRPSARSRRKRPLGRLSTSFLNIYKSLLIYNPLAPKHAQYQPKMCSPFSHDPPSPKLYTLGSFASNVSLFLCYYCQIYFLVSLLSRTHSKHKVMSDIRVGPKVFLFNHYTQL